MELPRHVLERAGDGGLEAHVDHLPAAGALASQQRRDRADRGERGRLMIGLQAEAPQRRTVRVTARREHAAHRLRDGVRRAPVAIRSVLPEGGDRRDDQTREARGAGGPGAGRAGVDHHVGRRAEALEQVAVDGDAPLAAGIEPEEQAARRIGRRVEEGRDAAQRGCRRAARRARRRRRDRRGGGRTARRSRRRGRAPGGRRARPSSADVEEQVACRVVGEARHARDPVAQLAERAVGVGPDVDQHREEGEAELRLGGAEALAATPERRGTRRR